MPGSTPATSQLDWLSSTTAMIVLSWSKATRDLLKSFSGGIRGTPSVICQRRWCHLLRRLPHTISPLEGAGFEASVPHQGQRFFESACPIRRVTPNSKGRAIDGATERFVEETRMGTVP